jgi:transposase
MRRSVRGLRATVQERFGEDAKSSLYIFVNKKKDRAKLLWHDVTGWYVLYKLLEERRVQLPQVNVDTRSVVVNMKTLAQLLAGVPSRQRHLTSREIAREAREKVRLSTRNHDKE